MNPLKWDNENPWVRTIRYLAFVGVAAAVVAINEALPSVDFPGELDATIIAVAGPLLAGLDKFLRSRA